MPTSFALRRTSLVVIPLALAACLVSCADSGVAPDGTPLDGDAGTIEEALFANDKTMYDYFVGKGLKNFQAAGIVGNLDQESGGDPTAVQPGGPGRGIAQWSVGGRWDTDANDNAKWYAAKKAQSVWSLQLQLDFIWYELTTFSGYGLAQLEATTNVTDATIVFQDKFEGCGTCDQSNRVTYAKNVLNAYGSTPPPAYAAKFVSQTYPYASQGAVNLTVGQTVKGHIVMQNVGTATWKAGVTKLAPIPRDKASPFEAGSWLSSTRVSSVSADVAPGQNGTFEWDLKGSAVGDFSPYFGFVEEGVTWFADAPKGGGPPDDDVQVHIVVKAAPPMGGSGGSGTAGSAGKGGTSSGGKGGASSGGVGGTAGKATGGFSTAGGGSGGHNGGSTSAGAAGYEAAGGAGAGGSGGAEEAGGSAGSEGLPDGGAITLEDEAPPQAGGCGCHVAPRTEERGWAFATVAALLAVGRRRKRRTA